MLGRARNTEACARCVGFSSFLAEVTEFQKYLAYNMMKKTWNIPHKAFEIFGWTFLHSFDVLKLYLYRLPAKAAKGSGSHFWKKSVYRGITLEGKKYILEFRMSKSE